MPVKKYLLYSNTQWASVLAMIGLLDLISTSYLLNFNYLKIDPEHAMVTNHNIP